MPAKVLHTMFDIARHEMLEPGPEQSERRCELQRVLSLHPRVHGCQSDQPSVIPLEFAANVSGDIV